MALTRVTNYPNRSIFVDPFQLFDDAFPQFWGRRPKASQGWNPPVDVTEDESFLTFVTELPGLEKDQLSISVDNNTLTISGQRSLAGKREDYHRLERSYGKFERSFSLPTTVESGKIAASLKSGVLTLTLPKKEEAKPRQIEVQVH